MRESDRESAFLTAFLMAFLMAFLVAFLHLLLLLGSASCDQMPKQMTIAAIFDHGGDPKHELAFKHAVTGIDRNRWGHLGVKTTF